MFGHTLFRCIRKGEKQGAKDESDNVCDRAYIPRAMKWFARYDIPAFLWLIDENKTRLLA